MASYEEWPKHFLYMSAPKINALFEQISARDLKGLAKSVTVDLRVVKAEFDPGALSRETIYSRLKVVLKHLDHQGVIGTVDEPNSYLSSRLAMKFGINNRSLGQFSVTAADDGDPSTELAWFAGTTETTDLGLNGSLQNMIGLPSDHVALSNSMTSTALDSIYKHLGLTGTPGDPEFAANLAYLPLWAVESAVDRSLTSPYVPTQNVEFVAKRLIWGESRTSPGRRVGLATPLYVALVD